MFTHSASGFEDNHRKGTPMAPMAQSQKCQSQQLNFPAVRSSCRTNAAPGGTQWHRPRWIFSHGRQGGFSSPKKRDLFADDSDVPGCVAFTEGCGWSGSSHAEYWEPQHLGCQHQATKTALWYWGDTLHRTSHTRILYIPSKTIVHHSKRPEIPQL